MDRGAMSLFEKIHKKPERLTEHTQTKLTPTDMRRLTELAKQLDVTPARLVRHFITEGLDNANKESI